MALADYENLLAEAARRLADAEPEAKVILFGSHARGEARPDSDLDFEGTMLNEAMREGRVLVPPDAEESDLP